MSGRFRDVGLRISRRILETPTPPAAPVPRRDPAVERARLDREAAAGLYCDKRRGYPGYRPRHYWDRLRDYWICRRCGFVWKPRDP